MPSYNLSTRGRIADLGLGMRVETGALNNTAVHGSNFHTRLFYVYGRVMITQLYGELLSAFSATATTVQFKATWTTPSISVADLSAACGSLTGQAQGIRITLVGGDVTTGAAITATAGISYASVAPTVLGLEGGVGYISTLTNATAATSGTIKYALHYFPMSAGAYCATSVLKIGP